MERLKAIKWEFVVVRALTFVNDALFLSLHMMALLSLIALLWLYDPTIFNQSFGGELVTLARSWVQDWQVPGAPEARGILWAMAFIPTLMGILKLFAREEDADDNGRGSDPDGLPNDGLQSGVQLPVEVHPS